MFRKQRVVAAPSVSGPRSLLLEEQRVMKCLEEDCLARNELRDVAACRLGGVSGQDAPPEGHNL